MATKQFTHGDISKSASAYKHRYYFTCAMISTCKPLLDRLDDNYAVEKVLREHKVIRGGSTDTESSQLWVYFGTRQAGEAFIDRLNAFLRKIALYEEKCAKGHPLACV